jgi:hypothetical protein
LSQQGRVYAADACAKGEIELDSLFDKGFGHTNLVRTSATTARKYQGSLGTVLLVIRAAIICQSGNTCVERNIYSVYLTCVHLAVKADKQKGALSSAPFRKVRAYALVSCFLASETL